MPKLVLFRHAKAAPPLPGQRDFDRPLTGRGRRDAERMGELLCGLGLDHALVSAAVRTRETFEIAARAMDRPPAAEIARDLYLCGAAKLIRRLALVPSGVAGLLVVGHNPDMQEVALRLAGPRESAETRAMRQAFPPAALAIFALAPGSWSDLGPGRAELERLVTPSEPEE